MIQYATMSQIDLDLLPAKIYRKDLQGRFIYANAVCVREMGCTVLEEMIGTTDFDYFDPELAQKWKLQEEYMISGRTDFSEQVEQEVWINREPTWAQTTKRLEYDSHGAPVAILGMSYDITASYLQFLRYHEAVEGHRDGVWQLDARTRNLWLSRRCLEILGRSGESIWKGVSTRQAIEIVHPDDHDRVKNLYRTITQEQSAGEVDFRIIRPDNTVVPIRLRLKATFDNAFKYPSELYGSITDRTDSVLQDSYRAFLDLVPSFIFVKDRQFKFTFVNQALADGFGIPARDIIGKTDAELNQNSAQVDLFRRDDEEVLAQGKPKSIPEETFDHKQFGRRVLKTIKVPLPGDQPGTFRGLVGVSTDITDLWEIREYLETLMEHVPDNVFFKNVHHQFIRVNAAMATNLGVESPADVVGRTDFDFYPSDQAAKWREEEQRIFQSGDSLRGDVRQTIPIKTAPQESQWRSVSKSPVYDPNGTVVGLVGIAHNLTEERNSRLLLSTVLDKIPLLIALQDTSGKYILCNRAFADHVGKPSSDAIGQPAQILPDAEALRRLEPHFDEALLGREYQNDSHEERDFERVTRHFALTMVPVYSGENGSRRVASVLTIRDELSHIVSRQKSFLHAQLEILDLLRSEEDRLRQHFLLLLSMTHSSSFGFNRAISWVYDASRPTELNYVHCIGQLNRDDAVRFKTEFPGLEKWTFEQCIRDFENLSESRDTDLASQVRRHHIGLHNGTAISSVLEMALKTNTINIEVLQASDRYPELSSILHDCKVKEYLISFVPLEERECIVILCDNIRTDRPIDTAVDDAGRSQQTEINDFLRSAQQNIVAATRHAAERARLSTEEAARQVAHNISHMLGNILPFTLEALERVGTKVSTKKDRDVDAISKDLLRAMDLVEDYRRYSQSIDQWALKRELVSVREVVETIRHYLVSRIPCFAVELDPVVSAATIDVDVNRLRQDCFAQLATNALSHSGAETNLKCKLTVSEFATSVETGLGQRRSFRWAEFVFADNGNGVPHEIKRKIFEPMYSTNPSGTGLGLPIAKRIVELLGGSINEIGIPGSGAAFRIRLKIIDA